MYKPLKYFARRGKAWLKRRLDFRTSRLDPKVLPYPKWLRQRIADRQFDYSSVTEKNLFSILTPVYDPPAGFFRILGESIFAQDHHDWQWVLVDNGCRQPDVLYLLERFARDPRVKFVQAPKPLGIIRGMRLALEHASGRYVCPVDHDDRIYRDALRVVAAYLQAFDWPKIAYSDEDKLLPDGTHANPFFKPDWDPLLFLNCCYVAHLGVMERKAALELDIYSDPASEGTPDGDAFCRFVAAGHEPRHIAEVLYSWRMHPQSTALLGVAAKPYVIASQEHAYSTFLEQRGLSKRVTLTTNPLPGIIGTWRVAPGPNANCGMPNEIDEFPSLFPGPKAEWPVLIGPGAPIHIRQIVLDRLALCRDIGPVLCLKSQSAAMLETLLQFSDEDWVCLFDPHFLPLTTDFMQEFDCVRQAIPDSVLVGGITLDSNQQIESAGLVWGFDGILGSPLSGKSPDDISFGAGALRFQRCATAVTHRFCFANVGFLRPIVHRHELDFGNPLLSAWLAAYAQLQGKRILFSSYIRCQALAEPAPRRSSYLEESSFLAQFGALLRYDRYYSPFLGLAEEHAYSVVRPDLRASALNKYVTLWREESAHSAAEGLAKVSLPVDRYSSPLALALEQRQELKRLQQSSSTSLPPSMTYSRHVAAQTSDSCFPANSNK